jgi:acetylornithine deacetylase/succinyl-diaminopimelate desuccinylase-like protein
VLVGAGIETRVLEPAPGRAAVVARLRGDGRARPILLLAHMDVVAVEPEHWTVDPFGGEVRDGYVWGRGAIDDKGMLAVELQTMLLFKRHRVDAGVPLARDVVLVATSDEETGGDWGLGWLLEHHGDLLRAEFAINEGGRIRVVDGRPFYAAVQTAEKVAHLLTLRAHGPPGHASIPLRENAVLRLGRALATIGEHEEPLRLDATTRGFFAGLAARWPDRRIGEAMADVASDDAPRAARGAAALREVPVLDAVLRTGITPTMLGGGIRANVIPADVTATLNVRTLPGEEIGDVARRLREAIDDPLVDVLLTDPGADAPASDPDSPLFRALADAVRELVPDITVVPYLSTGATDSARLRRFGVPCYGILPFPLAPEDESRMHGHDERVPVEGIEFGVRLLYGAVGRLV